MAGDSKDGSARPVIRTFYDHMQVGCLMFICGSVFTVQSCKTPFNNSTRLLLVRASMVYSKNICSCVECLQGIQYCNKQVHILYLLLVASFIFHCLNFSLCPLPFGKHLISCSLSTIWIFILRVQYWYQLQKTIQ